MFQICARHSWGGAPRRRRRINRRCWAGEIFPTGKNLKIESKSVFFFNINIAKSIRNQSILFKIWQVKGKSNRSTKLEAVCANEQRKRCFELSNERCLFSLPSPAISFPAAIHGRGSFHSADTRESWASFEELICFVSFERALDAVACFRGSRNGGSRIESRQTRE